MGRAAGAFSLKQVALLHEEQSRFQKIEVFRPRRGVISCCSTAAPWSAARDNFIYHEMMTHPVLFTHPAPERVAIIGGGDCGTLREVLRHPEVNA